MTLPKPPTSLRDDPEASGRMRDLLDEARHEDALDADALARVVARVDALGPAPIQAPRSSQFALKIGIAAMLTAIGIGIGVFSSTTPPTPTEDVPVVTATPEVAPPAEAPPRDPPALPVIETPVTEPAARASQPPSEGALLLAARVALRSSNPSRALSLTTQHEAHFPRGTMREERDVIAIEALIQLGERARAERRRSAFLLRYPSSPYRARIDALLSPHGDTPTSHE